MRKIYLTLVAFLSWMAMSVASFAIDVIVVSHGQANDPFWSVAKNGVDSACKDMKIKCKYTCLLYTSPSPRDVEESRMPSSA